MDQEKSGKLIAKLRKEKGLTQSELGDMVGVSDRSVSKWERGLTFPNVAIIKELCTILGISSNELLTGETKESSTETDIITNEEITTNHEETITNIRKIPSKKTIILTLLFLAILITSIIYIINTHSTIYTLRSANVNEYNVYGNITVYKNKISLSIDEMVFYDKELNNTAIVNYEYSAFCGNDFLIRNGYLNKNDPVIAPTTIEVFMKKFKIELKDNETVDRVRIENNGLTIRMTFVKADGEEINKKIDIDAFKSH